MSASDSGATGDAPARVAGGLSLRGLTNRLATPLVTGFFLISAVSGIALFFRWSPGLFREMHEWLSLVLVVPFAWHLWKNWRQFCVYATRGTLWVPLVACLAIAVPFAMAGMGEGGRSGVNPARIMPILMQARLSELAPLFKLTPEALMAGLRARGFTVTAPNDPIETIAKASGKRAPDVLVAAMQVR